MQELLNDCNSNHFYIMRHGNSMANQQEIVVSNPLNGVNGYGLSPLGKRQIFASIRSNQWLDKNVLIFSSDFLRARETAKLVHKSLACKNHIEFRSELRERFFGEYELGPDDIYEEVWQRDLLDADQKKQNVESVNEVMKRALGFVTHLSAEYQNEVILLIAHGDILQVLQTACAGRAPGEHRSMRHLETAEIRPLQFTTP